MDVFDQNTPPNNPAPLNDPFADKLKTIVNEAGQPKYQSTDTALDALAASQNHIKTLEAEAQARAQELATLREQALRAQTLEEVVNRLTPQNKTPVDPPQNVNVEETIAKQVRTALQQSEAEKIANSNGAAVRNALVQKFGDVDKTREAIAAKAAELGMSTEYLRNLSSTAPKMVLSLFGLNETNPNSSSPVVPSPTPLSPPKAPEPVGRPANSLISGIHATDKNRKEHMAKIKEEIYKKYDVTV